VQKIENIGPPKPKVPARCSKMPYFALFHPVVNGLQVDVAKTRELAGGEELRGQVIPIFQKFGLHPFTVLSHSRRAFEQREREAGAARPRGGWRCIPGFGRIGVST
jgi:hypothetical protein